MEKKEEKEKEDNESNIGKSLVRDASGKFIAGHPPSNIAPFKQTFNKEGFLSALKTVGNEHNEDYILHILRLNWGNPKFHKVIIDKFVEDASIASLGKAIQIGNTIILQFTGYQPKPETPIIEVLQEESKDNKE